MNERFFEVNMSRLTFEIHDGGLFVKESDVKTCDVEDEVMHTGNAIRKLAKYEQAEDDGLLVRLPCKVGDTVYGNNSMADWYMRHYKRHYKAKVIFIGIDGVTNFMNVEDDSGRLLQFKFSDIGKIVFLTREEAEQALKEAQENA